MPATRLVVPGLVLVALAAVGITVLTLATRSPSPASLELRLPEATRAPPADGVLKVYLTGAVRRPGVYTVREGDRVGDLVETAGGPTDDADTLAVNFARRLRDEDHVHVPRRGEAPPAPAAGTGRVDVNTASAAALETLPGIGPARAKAIVDSRTKDGPFAEPADLVRRRLLPQSVLDSIADLIVVRPP
jgi:competence protein ComEA